MKNGFNQTVHEFAGEHKFLSNFYPSSIVVILETDGGSACRVIAPTVEHAYQAMKATNEADFHKIAAAPTPGKAKQLGRKIFIRPDWDSIKDDTMLNLLRQKFQYWELRKKLMDTGNVMLVEGNHWGDTYWGMCKRTGKGENRLGLLLMHIRQEYLDALRP